MKRICVIGDSHAAALKRGWGDIAAEFPDLELIFFAARAQRMETLSLDGERLVGTTEGLRRQLELTSGGLHAIDGTRDGYILCGLGLQCQAALQMHRLLRAGEERNKLPADYNNDVLPKFLEEGFSNIAAIRILDMLRRITAAPAVLVPQPLRAEDDLSPQDAPPELGGGFRWLLPIFESAVSRLVAKHGASFLPQPPETLSETLLATEARYAKVPAKLRDENSEKDNAHMNGEYGAIVLRAALRTLANASNKDAAR